jgi:hypothetical protein
VNCFKQTKKNYKKKLFKFLENRVNSIFQKI